MLSATAVTRFSDPLGKCSCALLSADYEKDSVFSTGRHPRKGFCIFKTVDSPGSSQAMWQVAEQVLSKSHPESELSFISI